VARFGAERGARRPCRETGWKPEQPGWLPYKKPPRETPGGRSLQAGSLRYKPAIIDLWTVVDQALVSPDSKPSSKGSRLRS